VVMAGGSAILDYGRSTRTIPTPLWNAVVIRDDIVLLCSRHHHRLHQPGWHAKLTPDGAFEVTEPTGRVRNTSPPRAEPAWA